MPTSPNLFHRNYLFRNCNAKHSYNLDDHISPLAELRNKIRRNRSGTDDSAEKPGTDKKRAEFETAFAVAAQRFIVGATIGWAECWRNPSDERPVSRQGSRGAGVPREGSCFLEKLHSNGAERLGAGRCQILFLGVEVAIDIARILLKHGVLSEEAIEPLLEQCNGSRIDRFVIERGLASEQQVLQAMADEFGMQCVDVTSLKVDRELLDSFPTREIFRHMVFPIERRNGIVVVAISDPLDLDALDELSSLTGFELEAAFARRDELNRLIKDELGVGGGTIGELVAQRSPSEIELLSRTEEDEADTDEAAQQASVVKLVNELLVDAIGQRASDVHIEPGERGLTIRFRVDGILQIQPVPDEIKHFYAAIITRLKIMSQLNIAEKRLPQDGRIKLRVSGREIDVRASFIPMLYGEGVVLRLLDKQRMVFSLSTVGMPASIAEIFQEMISLPHGIVLVTGPTGSGKTTTLYSALNTIKSPMVKIITVEDPVEYHIDGISQIQVHGKIGLSFASGLRSILRHDPDVILLGEIRDSETADSAIQSSLTGHLVFSTLHTNDASGAFTRLIDMGVEPYLVASSVEGVIAQRLVRVLCTDCREPYRPNAAELPSDFPQPHPEQLWKPVGCRECHGTGYRGRSAIFELLRTDEGIRRLCVERASSAEMRRYALQNGLTTLRECGWQKVIDGTTSVDEVVRITKGDSIASAEKHLG